MRFFPFFLLSSVHYFRVSFFKRGLSLTFVKSVTALSFLQERERERERE